MGLDHVLLGLLKEPQSGYSIKQWFDLVFNHFWAAKISQIYRNLKSLEKRGLLESWEEPSSKGPSRRMYKRTHAGLEELRRCLAEGPDFVEERVPYLAQAAFLYELEDRTKAVEFFERVEEYFAARLRMLADIDAEIRRDLAANFPNSVPFEELCGHLTLQHGLYRSKALLDWSSACLRALNNKNGDWEHLPEANPLLSSHLHTLPKGEPS